MCHDVYRTLSFCIVASIHVYAYVRMDVNGRKLNR